MAILDITAELANYESRESKFAEISKMFKKITKKNVYADFNFPRAGKIMGIVRHILQNPRHEEKLLEVSGLRKSQIEFFRDCGGNTSYLNSDGEIVPTKQMDIEKCQAIVRLIANNLQMALEDSDIENEITSARWKSIAKLSEKRARASKRGKELVNTNIIPEE